MRRFGSHYREDVFGGTRERGVGSSDWLQFRSQNGCPTCLTVKTSVSCAPPPSSGAPTTRRWRRTAIALGVSCFENEREVKLSGGGLDVRSTVPPPSLRNAASVGAPRLNVVEVKVDVFDRQLQGSEEGRPQPGEERGPTTACGGTGRDRGAARLAEGPTYDRVAEIMINFLRGSGPSCPCSFIRWRKRTIRNSEPLNLGSRES